MAMIGLLRSVGVVILLATAHATAGDMPDWADFAGVWRGAGMLGDGPTGALERGVCKFDMTVSDDGFALSMNGRCANTAQSATMTIVLEATPSSDRIMATTRSRVLPGPVVLSGVMTGNGLDLSSDAPVELDDRAYAIATRIDMGGDKTSLTIVQSLTDMLTGVTSERLRMVFERLE